MYINAFWFGLLIGVIAVVLLLIVVAFISGRHSEDEEEEVDISPAEYKAAMEKLTGQNIRVYRDKRGYLVGEAVEDPDDQEQ